VSNDHLAPRPVLRSIAQLQVGEVGKFSPNYLRCITADFAGSRASKLGRPFPTTFDLPRTITL
jgi:hypothetical protein